MFKSHTNSYVFVQVCCFFYFFILESFTFSPKLKSNKPDFGDKQRFKKDAKEQMRQIALEQYVYIELHYKGVNKMIIYVYTIYRFIYFLLQNVKKHEKVDARFSQNRQTKHNCIEWYLLHSSRQVFPCVLVTLSFFPCRHHQQEQFEY